MAEEQEAAAYAPPPDLQPGVKVERPWGHFKVIDHGPGFVVKALLIKGKQRLSLQKHQHRAELWVGAMGTARAAVGGVKHELAPGDTIHVPAGLEHRLENPGLGPVVVVEVQTGERLREADIIRLADDYGRALIET